MFVFQSLERDISMQIHHETETSESLIDQADDERPSYKRSQWKISSLDPITSTLVPEIGNLQ